MVDDGKIQLLIVSLLHEERIATPLSGDIPKPQCLYIACSTSHIYYLIFSIKISVHCPLRQEEGYDAGFDDGFADSGCDSEEEE